MTTSPAPDPSRATRRPDVLERGSADATEGALLLHASGLSSVQWTSLARELAARGLRVVAPDLIGHGRSTPWPAESRFEVARDLELTERHLASLPEAVHLIGHSYGGYLALRLVLAGHRVRSLTVYEPPAFGVLGTGEERFDPEGAYTQPELRGTEAWMKLMVDFWNGPGAYDALPAARRRVMLQSGAKAFDEVRAVVADVLPAELLARIECPTLVLCGTQTPAVAQRVCQRLAALVPGARLERLEGAGHMAPVLESERINRHIVAHLARVASLR